jgi:DNA-directed RNA polymerase specialized sigma subunit
MKIPLKMSQENGTSGHAAEAKVIERDVLAAKGGDWNAKNNLVRTLTPLLRSRAEKHAATPADLNRFIEAGKEGLSKAIRKYNSKVGGSHFQVFALDFIDQAMDREAGGGGGFFARLFGR